MKIINNYLQVFGIWLCFCVIGKYLLVIESAAYNMLWGVIAWHVIEMTQYWSRWTVRVREP